MIEFELLKRLEKSGTSIRSFRNLPFLWEYDSAIEQVRKEDVDKLIAQSYITDLFKPGNKSIITRKGLSALKQIEKYGKVIDKPEKKKAKPKKVAEKKKAAPKKKVAPKKKPIKKKR